MRAISIPARTGTRALRPKRLLVLAGDETLVEQMQRGNAAAYEIVFERHGAGILAFCRHMLGRHDEAEDAVQLTFAAAFNDLQRGDSRELALKPWLYAIARNRCISILRSRRDHVAIGDEPAGAGLAEQVERRADLRELLRDVRELPEEQRAALLLAEAGGLSHADVADVLGCEVARVKALVFRARSRLIERREARETPCEEIREQLANLRGGALRRTVLRHHLRECHGCRDYLEQVRQQRRMLAAALPVAPSVGLKSGVLAAIGIGGGSAGGGLAAGLGGLSASVGAGTAAKVAAVCALAGGGVVTGEAVLQDTGAPAPPPAAAPAPGSANARVAQQSPPPQSRERLRVTAPRVTRQPPSAAERPVRSGGAGPVRVLDNGPSVTTRQPVGKPKSKPGHRVKLKPAPPTPPGQGTGLGHGPQERGPKIDSTAQGRGPIAAPPMSEPVKRGPPQPKPGPKEAAKGKAQPAVTGAIPAPETKTKPAPEARPPVPEARPPKESKAATE
jgi:RNA polymerase sigma factor (sigma-70 family)